MTNFDNLLICIKEFGPYQKWMYVFLCLGCTPAIVVLFTPLFIIPPIEHRCSIPGFQNDTFHLQDEDLKVWLNHTVPGYYDPEKCRYYWSRCKIFRENGNGTEPCHEWVFDKSDFQTSLTEDLSLVCEQKNWRSHILMANMIGMLIGSTLFGTLSDRFGRKKIFTAANVLIAIVSAVGLWTPNIAFVFVTRLILGGLCLGLFLAVFVYIIEMVGPSKRMWAAVCINYFSVVYLLAIDGFAYAVREWKYIQLMNSLIAVIFIPYIWLIPESPRWLLTNGRVKEGMAVIEKMAKSNKSEISKEIYNSLNADSEVATADDKLWNLCQSPKLVFRFIIVIINWIAVTLSYYVLLLHSAIFAGKIYLNIALGCVVELPSYVLCLLLMNRIGRRLTHAGFMISCGVACVSSIFPVVFSSSDNCSANEWNYSILLPSLVGRLCATASFAVIYTFTSELFPTTLRNGAIGISSMSARVGGIAAPYIANMNVGGKFGPAFPLLIIGVAALVAGILALTLPETANKKLPDTAEEFEVNNRNGARC